MLDVGRSSASATCVSVIDSSRPLLSRWLSMSVASSVGCALEVARSASATAVSVKSSVAVALAMVSVASFVGCALEVARSVSAPAVSVKSSVAVALAIASVASSVGCEVEVARSASATAVSVASSVAVALASLLSLLLSAARLMSADPLAQPPSASNRLLPSRWQLLPSRFYRLRIDVARSLPHAVSGASSCSRAGNCLGRFICRLRARSCPIRFRNRSQRRIVSCRRAGSCLGRRHRWRIRQVYNRRFFCRPCARCRPFCLRNRRQRRIDSCRRAGSRCRRPWSGRSRGREHHRKNDGKHKRHRRKQSYDQLVAYVAPHGLILN